MYDCFLDGVGPLFGTVEFRFVMGFCSRRGFRSLILVAVFDCILLLEYVGIIEFILKIFLHFST